MLKNSLLTLDLGALLLIGARVTTSATQIAQRIQGSNSIKLLSKLSVSDLTYRGEATKVFFCSHN